MQIKKTITGSLSTTIVESADAVSGMAEAVRRTFQIANTALKSAEAELYVDGLASLVDKGLTQEQAEDLLDTI